jgi:hypothetical protein
MKLPRRNFLHLAAGTAALPTVCKPRADKPEAIALTPTIAVRQFVAQKQAINIADNFWRARRLSIVYGCRNPRPIRFAGVDDCTQRLLERVRQIVNLPV